MTIRIDGTNTAANPGITGTDTDTGLQFGTDEVNIVTGGTTRATVDSSGRVLVGTTTAASTGSWAQYAKLSTQGNTALSTGGGALNISTGTAASSGISTGVSIGNISFSDSGGNEFALIQCRADNTTGVNDYPGRLGFFTTADGASSATERMRITSAGDLRFNSGYGSVATAYACRVWVNFNGTGSVSSSQIINGSGNVSSVWKNATGQYTVNFANAMPDANYSVVAEAAGGNTGNMVPDVPQTTQVNILGYTSVWGTGDRNPACVAVFR